MDYTLKMDYLFHCSVPRVHVHLGFWSSLVSFGYMCLGYPAIPVAPLLAEFLLNFTLSSYSRLIPVSYTSMFHLLNFKRQPPSRSSLRHISFRSYSIDPVHLCSPEVYDYLCVEWKSGLGFIYTDDATEASLESYDRASAFKT